jgi:hypothetical protein
VAKDVGPRSWHVSWQWRRAVGTLVRIPGSARPAVWRRPPGPLEPGRPAEEEAAVCARNLQRSCPRKKKRDKKTHPLTLGRWPRVVQGRRVIKRTEGPKPSGIRSAACACGGESAPLTAGRLSSVVLPTSGGPPGPAPPASVLRRLWCPGSRQRLYCCADKHRLAGSLDSR